MTVPAIDHVEIHVAGQLVTLRQAAMRILRRMINFVEEEQLNNVARMINDGRLLKPDLERAVTSWATSKGSESVRYFTAIIDKLVDDHKRQIANNRKPTLPEVVIEDKDEVARFLTWLKERHYHGHIVARDAGTVFQSQEIESWYSRFCRDATTEEQSCV